MRQLKDTNEVKLSRREQDAERVFDSLLSEGFWVTRAAHFVQVTFPGIDPQFILWLNDGEEVP